MSSHVKDYERSIKERIYHGILFEILAIGIATPLAMWLTGKSFLAMGVLSAVISLMAISWNIVFNWFFDRLQSHLGFKRNVLIRILHSIAFELGLIIMAVPFIAWWINSSLIHAFIVDIGLLLFFLPYTFFFNLSYDKIRVHIIRHQRLKTQ